MLDRDEPIPKRVRTRTPNDEQRSSESSDNLQDETTEFKLVLLASVLLYRSQEELLNLLLDYEGDVERAIAAVTQKHKGGTEFAIPQTIPTLKRKHSAAIGYQSSIHGFATRQDAQSTGNAQEPRAVDHPVRNRSLRPLTKKGKTIHLYSPRDIEQHTPCSIVHNFLSSDEADALLRELVNESESFARGKFQLFDRVVQSPHTYRFYVDSLEQVKEQKTEYLYGGTYEQHVTQTTPWMARIAAKVQEKVNEEAQRRMKDFQPNGEKLPFQSPEQWEPNASFVNCYDGGKESVGYHSDQLTYLGPRAIIGSLSLGVAREFRVRRIVPSEDGPAQQYRKSTEVVGSTSADEQGQIAIHLPHNSLLIMHAEMQEEWKHSVAPASAITPHPIAGNKRLNVTYRCYQPYLHPRYTPKCKCNIPTILRCVQRRKETKGRYMWMCYANYTPGQKGCEFFSWAEFDIDGKPPWVEGYKGNANVPQPSSAS